MSVNEAVAVSVIMPCRNGERYLRQAVESVQAQTFTDWELLIIDNQSVDRSREMIAELTRQDCRIVALQCEELGAAATRNIGIQRSRGRFIAFLDADDLWFPNKLERQMEAMKISSLAFCWASYKVIDAQGAALRDQRCAVEASYEGVLRKESVIGCLTAVYDKAAFGLQYMPSIAMRQDFGLWLRLFRLAAERGLRCAGVDEFLASYRVHSDGLTKNKLRAAYYQWQLYRKVERLSILRALSCMWLYATRAVRDRAAANK